MRPLQGWCWGLPGPSPKAGPDPARAGRPTGLDGRAFQAKAHGGPWGPPTTQAPLPHLQGTPKAQGKGTELEVQGAGPGRLT